MQRVLVLGLGVSGLAAAEFLLARGYYVIGLDDKKMEDLSVLKLKERGLEVHLDSMSVANISFDLLVVSPGISPSHPVYSHAREKGIEIIGEAELSLRYLQQPCVAITGTNGKTTVTLLTAHVLNHCGIKAKALGNVGNSLTSYLLAVDLSEVLVVELSSFQLETMTTRAFTGAVLLNITPDHLDRYATMEEYARAKCHLQKCLKPQAPFYVQEQVVVDYGHLLEDGYSLLDLKEIESFLPVGYREWGRHEKENTAAAWMLCRLFSVSPAEFCAALATFRKPPHRIEWIKVVDGVSYFDDSKGTNIDAVIQAVRAMKGPVVLIAGGVDKGFSYLPWKEHFQGKVKAIIAIGQAAPKIDRELGPFVEVERAETLAKAVAIAAEMAVRGDNVLLSPGCSSFDMFRDYAHRGEQFQHHVHQLVEKGEKT